MTTSKSIKDTVINLIRHEEYDRAWQHLDAHDESIIPSDADFCMLGVLALQKKPSPEPEKALARTKAWLKKEPAFIPAIHAAGILCYELGRYKEAIKFLLKANEIDPDKIRHSKRLKIIFEIRLAYIKFLLMKPFLSKLFIDLSDFTAFILWIFSKGLIVWYFIIPYSKGLTKHPTFGFIIYAYNYISNNLSMHIKVMLLSLLIVFVIGVFLQNTNYRPQSNEKVIFSRTRRIWSYHWRWLLFFLAVAASAYTNQVKIADIKYYKEMVGILGLITIFIGVYCFWLFLPNSRTKVQLIKSDDNRQNRLIISEGVIMPSVKTYMPDVVKAAVIKRSLIWIITFTRNIHIQLNSGKELLLIAPSSLSETSGLSEDINLVIEASKIYPMNGSNGFF